MSAAATPADAGAAPAPKKGKKKLIIIVALAVLLLGGGAGGFFIMKKKAADAAAAAAAEEDGGDGEAAPAAHAEAAHVDPKHPPTFVPLDPFVVNLADRDSERYAQIGITLEVDDAKFADSMKVYMPAIRNGILMVLAHKSSQELLQRSGKEALAAEILRESVRPLGIEIDDEEDPPADEAAASHEGTAKAKKPKKKKKKAVVHNPVQKVHFSNFIIQ
jgi:flagellar FliL protein